MTTRDRLISRSLGVLCVMVTGSIVIQATDPTQWPLLPTGFGYLTLIAVAFAMARRGYTRAAAAVLIGLGAAVLAVLVVVTGGPESRFVAFLPMTAMAASSWLGRKAGLAVTVLLCIALAVAWALAVPTEDLATDFELFLAHAAAVVLGSAFLFSVTRDLRIAAEVAWERAVEAEQAAATAHAADEARDRFLATVSHELRTPLDTVLGYAEMLREEEDDRTARGTWIGSGAPDGSSWPSWTTSSTCPGSRPTSCAS